MAGAALRARSCRSRFQPAMPRRASPWVAVLAPSTARRCGLGAEGSSRRATGRGSARWSGATCCFFIPTACTMHGPVPRTYQTQILERLRQEGAAAARPWYMIDPHSWFRRAAEAPYSGCLPAACMRRMLRRMCHGMSRHRGAPHPVAVLPPTAPAALLAPQPFLPGSCGTWPPSSTSGACWWRCRWKSVRVVGWAALAAAAAPSSWVPLQPRAASDLCMRKASGMCLHGCTGLASQGCITTAVRLGQQRRH